jgi:SSS family solute:Na+ symporter
MTPLVEPAFYQRTFAARGSREVVRALLLGVVLWIAYDWLVVYLGIAGKEMVRTGVLRGDVPAPAILLHVVGELLPAGLLGLFIAGCLASAMSTIDSYTLIAAGNVVYDAFGPGRPRGTTEDARMLRAVRIATVPTLAFALAVSFLFESIRDAWIFMATILLSTALVPMLAALFTPSLARRRAGSWSAITGLAVSATLGVLFHVLGTEDADLGTVTWSTPAGFTLVREHAVLIAVPASLLGFVAGWFAGDPVEPRP